MMSAKPYIATDMISASHMNVSWVPGRNYRLEEQVKISKEFDLMITHYSPQARTFAED